MLKKCASCGEEKELNLENFGIRKSSKTGFDSRCKECRKKYDKERYQKNKDRLNNKSKEYYRKNSDARKEYGKKYYAENVDKCRKTNKSWERANHIKRRVINDKSRAGAFGCTSVLTEKKWLQIKAIFKNCCAYCGMGENEHLKKYGEHLHIEHITPLEDGGNSEMGNVVPACRYCNNSKKNKSFFDWYRDSRGYSEQRETKILDYIEKEVKN